MLACAVRTDGELACWEGDYDVLGTPPAGPFIDVSVSADASLPYERDEYFQRACALDRDGDVLCWGYDVSVERRVQGPFVEIATGYGTDCARRADGTAVCWAGTADALELDGTFTTIGAGERVQALRTDGTVVDIAGSVVTVPVDGTFVELAVGGDFACGLDEDGHVRCWGSRAR